MTSTNNRWSFRAPEWVLRQGKRGLGQKKDRWSDQINKFEMESAPAGQGGLQIIGGSLRHAVHIS